MYGVSLEGERKRNAASGSEHAHSEYRAKVKPGEIRTTQMMLASQARFPNTGLKIRAKFWIFQKMRNCSNPDMEISESNGSVKYFICTRIMSNIW